MLSELSWAAASPNAFTILAVRPARISNQSARRWHGVLWKSSVLRQGSVFREFSESLSTFEQVLKSRCGGRGGWGLDFSALRGAQVPLLAGPLFRHWFALLEDIYIPNSGQHAMWGLVCHQGAAPSGPPMHNDARQKARCSLDQNLATYSFRLQKFNEWSCSDRSRIGRLTENKI